MDTNYHMYWHEIFFHDTLAGEYHAQQRTTRNSNAVTLSMFSQYVWHIAVWGIGNRRVSCQTLATHRIPVLQHWARPVRMCDISEFEVQATASYWRVSCQTLAPHKIAALKHRVRPVRMCDVSQFEVQAAGEYHAKHWHNTESQHWVFLLRECDVSQLEYHAKHWHDTDFQRYNTWMFSQREWRITVWGTGIRRLSCQTLVPPSAAALSTLSQNMWLIAVWGTGSRWVSCQTLVHHRIPALQYWVESQCCSTEYV